MDENNLRDYGLKHCYLDTNLEDFSNVGVGILSRSVGQGLKIGYFNSKKCMFNLVDFFYRFYLRNLDFFPFNSLNLDLVKDYDVLIFDNFSYDNVFKDDFNNVLKNCSKKTEIIVICNNLRDFDLLKDDFDLVSEFSYKDNKKGYRNISSIYGNGKGKSTYSFGFIIRKLIEDNFVKLVYFDKGGDFYSEKFFFEKLKYINRKFQFFSYGKSRIEGEKFRFENTQDDLDEAKYALDELNRSYDEHVIIAEEINTCYGSKLLGEDEIIANLKNIKNEILITGRCSSNKILEVPYNLVGVKEIKHYVYLGHKIRKGIDF